MRNKSNKHKSLTHEQAEQIGKIYDRLDGIPRGLARHHLACEIWKDSQSIDDFIGV